MSAPHFFDQHTTLEQLAEDRFRADVAPEWWVMAGPNGGYLAALLMRAIQTRVDDPTRVPRSLTVHYLEVPVQGPAEIEARIERGGRKMSTVTARLLQDGRLCAVAIAALSAPRRGIVHQERQMPEVPMAESLEPSAPNIPMNRHYDLRFLPGLGRDAANHEAHLAAWLRLAPPRPIDYAQIAAYMDCLPPALFTTGRSPEELGGVPTIDLTIHFRADLSLLDLAPDAFALGLCRSRTAGEGFVEEDMELWSPGGVLLAHSRQLALARGR